MSTEVVVSGMYPLLISKVVLRNISKAEKRDLEVFELHGFKNANVPKAG